MIIALNAVEMGARNAGPDGPRLRQGTAGHAAVHAVLQSSGGR